MIITPTSLTVAQLLASPNEQYVIPPYQRRYSWHEKQVWELIDDISLIEGSDTHLLGSIVCLTGHHKAGINELELVDGQQRLTTISILLHCILERLKADNEHSEAQDVERLLQSKPLGQPPMRKIALDTLDGTEFDRLAAGGTLDNPSNRNLASAFEIFRNWLSRQELAKVGSFLYRLRNQAIVIRLDVGDAKDAFKLFETINNRGLRLSPTDIIKNFILGNAARFGVEQLRQARTRWAEVIESLDGMSIDAFFRHFLCAQLQRRITISYIIQEFKTLFMQTVSEAATLPDRHWYADLEDDQTDDREEDAVPVSTDEQSHANSRDAADQVSFSAFLERLTIAARVYGQLAHARTGNAKIDRRLRNLRMIKSLQTYGFLMALRVNGCSDANFEKILALTESFLLRRHICRERANENETLFARLCSVDAKTPIAEVTAEYRRLCPSDEKFEQEFSTFEFGPNLIERARYCLERFEMHRQGKHQELFVGGADTVHVEHIIPIKIKTRRAKVEFGDWVNYLGPGAEAKHTKYVSRIGNLTLLAEPLNIGASNNPYERKTDAYLNSALKLTNSLPGDFPEFRFDAVEKRSNDLAKLAIELWASP